MSNQSWEGISGHNVDLWEDDALAHVRYGQWRENKNGRYIVPNYTSGSDYSGSLVNVSNYQVFQEEFKDGDGVWWSTAPGGLGTFALIIDTQTAPKEALEFFAALEEYPLADEEHHSTLEYETQIEAFENWTRKDFVDALSKKFEKDFAPENDEATELFHDLCERSNTYWVNEEGSSVWIDLDRVVASATSKDVQDWPVES